jgi:hypothetical protein
MVRDKIFFVLFLAVAVLLLVSSKSLGQDLKPPVFAYSCLEQDYIAIKDDGSDRAIVTYSNSIENCSNDLNWIFEAPNGIKVRIQIKVGGTGEHAEVIYLYPLTPGYMAFPPEGNVLDGEKMEFIIQGGLS